MRDTDRMTASPDVSEPAGPLWSTAAVARRLGVSPATLRSWSRRYGIGPAGHDPGRHRRYTAADVAELDAIRRLVGNGVVLPAAAEMVRRQRLAGYAAPARSPDPVPVPPGASAPVAELVTAAVRLDPDTADDLVAAELGEHGVLATWERLCLPAIRGLDPVVAGDQGCVDSQLLLSWVLIGCLRRLSPTTAAQGGRPVLLACTADEQHTLGLDVLHAALAERGVRARMLGATVPDPALLHAATQLHPSSVVVWAQRPDTARPALMTELGAHTDLVVAAGPGWCESRLPAAVTEVDDLRAVLALVGTGTGPTAT